MVERGRTILTPEETASMLELAEGRMDLSLKGEWNVPLAKARYAAVVGYQPGITPEVCDSLFNLSSSLVRKAWESEDEHSARYFGRAAESWGRLGFLLQSEQTRV